MRKKPPSVQLPPAECVIRVGAGRGFIVEHHPRRIIVTAAHCLPNLPPAHASSYTEERTYRALLGTLCGDCKIWAECLFVDPVSDIAVLGGPDNQELFDEAEAYEELVANAPALSISSKLTKGGWVMSLKGNWVPMPLDQGLSGQALFINHTEGGQSGSPILNEVGEAVGVIVVGGSIAGVEEEQQGPQPILCRDLPARYVALLQLSTKP